MYGGQWKTLDFFLPSETFILTFSSIDHGAHYWFLHMAGLPVSSRVPSVSVSLLPLPWRCEQMCILSSSIWELRELRPWKLCLRYSCHWSTRSLKMLLLWDSFDSRGSERLVQGIIHVKADLFLLSVVLFLFIAFLQKSEENSRFVLIYLDYKLSNILIQTILNDGQKYQLQKTVILRKNVFRH